MELTDEKLRGLFSEAADFNTRSFACCGQTLYLYAIDGLTSGSEISDFVVRPLVRQLRGETMLRLYNNALSGGIVNSVAKPCKDCPDAATFLLNGFCVILFPGIGALAFETKTGEKRSIAPPELENTAKGPKDAFVETVRSNTSLVRRHLRTCDLRLYETRVGNRSRTNVCVVWLYGTTNPAYVTRLKRRLASIDIDGLISASSVEEAVTGSRRTAFPLLQYTQRTDRFCQGLLDGRVGLFVDGIPLGYLLPVDLGYLMNSPEDYSRDYVTASCVRVLRYAALLFDLLMPALYVAFTVHHWSLLPPSVAQVILQGREAVPFSPIWEILCLLVAFELLQESGVHLPQNIGQSVSIIGGIVVGTVGVEAGLISSIALIVVSIAGVCGFVLPNRDLANAVRVWRFAIAVAAGIAGVWGIAAALAVLVFHLLKLRSLDTPYITLFESHLFRPRLPRSDGKKE